jgi:membrane protease YdiL (CAAX protease family)
MVYLPTISRLVFEDRGLATSSTEKVELKLVPILKMLVVIAVVASVIVLMDWALRLFFQYEVLVRDSFWIIADLVHVPQFVIPFGLIWYITRGKLSEYGFNSRQDPPIFTHRRMLALGGGVGLLLSLEYILQAVRGEVVGIPQPVTVVNVLGNLSFQWIVVGLAEETMFRGLIQTYLMSNLKGWVRLLGHDLHAGTVVGAIFWGLFHFLNVLTVPVGSVVFVVVLTTVAGLLMGYAYQKTGSLLTTVIVHNTMFGVPLTVGYVLYWLL